MNLVPLLHLSHLQLVIPVQEEDLPPVQLVLCLHAVSWSLPCPGCRGGEPEKPLLVHVGRLGAEKNLALLRP